METTDADRHGRCERKVLTVPMRNGNERMKGIGGSDAAGSYRTYEEWKPLANYIKQLEDLVLTVPMRNGNKEFVREWRKDLEFLPYL